MMMAMVPAPDRPVTLRDAETARHIARTAAKGTPGDRQPTLEHLLAAFEESVPTPQARARVAAALGLAGVRTVPDLEHAEPGSRVSLTFTGTAGPSPSRSAAAGRALTGIAVLAAFIGAMALASGIGGDGERADVLPATATTPTTATATTPAVTTTPTTAQPTTTGERIEDEAVTTESKAITDAAKRAEQAEAEREAERRAAARKREIGRRVARRRAAARRAAAARRGVTVRVTPVSATYLCVDDGSGKRLFAGTLTSRRTFKAKEIRLNVGLASTRVTINGKPYRLSGSPSGVSITRKRVVPLALGARPCS